MKLHLPKALFTAVMAVFALSQTTYAETYNLLESSDGWTLNGFSYNPDTDIISKSGSWGDVKTATYYDANTVYTVGDDNTLQFDLTFKTTGGASGASANNYVLTFAFMGADDKIVVGGDYYHATAMGYGTPESIDTSYNDETTNLTSFSTQIDGETVAANRAWNTEYTVNGMVTYADEKYSLVLTLNDGANEYKTDAIDLGSTFNLTSFTMTGAGGSDQLTSLTITGNMLVSRYDATVSGDMAVADASWSLLGDTYTTDQINLTDGSAKLGLSGSGEGASITFASGTNVQGVEILAGSVIMKSDGGMTTGTLLAKDGASATIATEMTAGSVSGAVTITETGKLVYTGTDMGFLGSTTGTGTISLADGKTIAAGTNSSFAGVIDVAAGKQLNYGNDQGSALSLSSATVQLNEGSTLYVEAYGATLGILDVQGNATLRAYDSNGAASAALTIGEVRIAANKTLATRTNWEGMLVFDNLNAEGTLEHNPPASSTPLVINAIEKSGAIKVTNASGKLTLGAGASSVLNLGGDVTNAGTLIIKGQLAGESTISGGTINVESTASVTGDITFGSNITLAGTLQNSGSLTLGGNVSVSGVEGLTTVENATVTYSSNEGKDGYIASSQYYVVQGTGSATSSLTGTSVLTSGGVEIGTITQSADGKSLVADVALDAPGGIWYVNTQDFTIDGNDTNLAKDATGYKVAAGKTLTIAANQNGTMTAGKILSETTGAGNITLTTDAVMTGAAQATGKLTVSGATLTVDAGGVFVNDFTNTYLSSFSSMELDGATINYQGHKTTWQSVTVGSNGATLNIRDMGEYPNDTVDMITFAGTTTLNGALTIQSATFGNYGDSWKFGVNIESLTGEGDLSVISSTTASPSETSKVNVKLQETYTGTLSLTHNLGTATQLNVTADGDINLEGLNVSGGSGAQVDLSGVTGTKNLGAVSVGANTTLNLQGTIGDMVATGDGTISLADGTAFTGTASIANGLTLAGTITNSGNLTLTGGLTASSLEVFDAAGESAISYANGDVEGNGYLSTALTIVQSAADSSQLTANGLTLTVAGTAYNLSQNGNDLQLIISGDGGEYYVTNTQDYAAGTKIADAATTGIVMNGGTLNLNTALADGISISTAAAGSVINVADGVTLANSSVTAGSTKSTITGGSTAVYDMGSGWSVEKMVDLGLGEHAVKVTFGEDWNGVTLLTNVTIGQSNLDSFTREGGTLKLVGYSGWMSFIGSDATVNSNLVLENYANTVDGVTTTKSAFVFDDNSQGKKYNFNGNISGSGDFQIASQAESSATITFAGDTEEWKGGIVVTNAYNSTGNGKNRTNTVDVNLTAGGNIFSADGNKGFVMDRASTNDGDNIINLNIGNADAASTMNGAISMGENADDRAQLNLTVKGNTTFKNEVEVTSLTVDANKTATLEAATTTDALTTNGTIKVTGNGSLTYGGTTTVWAPYTGYNTEAAAATITSDAITGGSVTINNAEDVTESRVISDSAISKYGEGTANVAVGDTNAAVWVEEGNLAMTAANGSTSVAEMTIAAGSQVSTTGNLTVTDSLTILATDALSVTGALTLAGAEINLTNLTLQEGVTSYTLGTVTTGDIDTTGVSLKFGADQLAAAGFEGYTATVGASATDATALVLTLTAPEQPGEPDPGVTTLTEITITGGTYADNVLTFTTTADLTNTVFGDKLDAIMSEEVWAAIVGATTLPEEVLVSFTDANGALIDFDGDGTATAPAITINGEGTKGAQVLTGNGTIVGGYVTSYIPEPTTTTLSLLALAGLAVRRRRK